MIVVSYMSFKGRRSKVIHSLGKCIVLSHKLSMTCLFLCRTVAKDIQHFSMQDRLFSQCYLPSLRSLALEVLEFD